MAFGRPIKSAKSGCAENAFALHLFLQRLQSLIDIVVANENLHESILRF